MSDQIQRATRWETLRFAVIVGIVDAYGAVHSRLVPLRDSNGNDSHTEIFGTKGHCAWRWAFNNSIFWISDEMKPDAEQYLAIQQHLTKKYGLKWWDNGHHDINHFLEQLSNERNSP